MNRLRCVVVPLLGDARYALAMLAVALLFVACFAARVVVAVVQDVVGSARRLVE